MANDWLGTLAGGALGWATTPEGGQKPDMYLTSLGANESSSSSSGTNSASSMGASSQYSGLSDWALPFSKDILGQAQGMFGKTQFSPLMQQTSDWYFNQIAGPRSQHALNINNLGMSDYMGGSSLNLPAINAGAARQSQGMLDPTMALAQAMSGQVNIPVLQGVNQANINDALIGYGDAIDKLNTEVMPTIRSGAVANGYGSSRQGIAEGLALQQMQKNARDLGRAALDSGNKLYGNAYENAQGRAAGVAGSLNDQAVNIGFTNNNQMMGMNAQNLANRQFGLNALGMSSGMMDSGYQNAMNALNAPNTFGWQNLGNYSNIANPYVNTGGRYSSGSSSNSSSSSGFTSSFGSSSGGNIGYTPVMPTQPGNQVANAVGTAALLGQPINNLINSASNWFGGQSQGDIMNYPDWNYGVTPGATNQFDW